ncbi:DNA repair RAD52-like protein 1, mitochondrial isoform X1 [Capsella rubella]|uniref:DNA repair RAD52-like protein 1, mitochondrial isoform X1 n=1 Tax=Capsella rubella TaxID=81985 RepID=UPI000CD531EB|nr:DNA repair RAD52-like protein 1, mitochondrial isoform X1 [Capsella rubella]
MAGLGLRLKAATWTLRSGAATLTREMGKGVRRFSSEVENDVPTSGISRPLAEILKELNKKIPDSVIRTRVEDGSSIKYIPWHIVNRIMNMHAPGLLNPSCSFGFLVFDIFVCDSMFTEWSGEVRSVTYSPDGNTVTVAYRVTLYGTDAEIFRESTGTTPVDCKGYGDAVQKAEAMAFRRACARFGLGLHLYHEDAL